jgi:hypothetical protein
MHKQTVPCRKKVEQEKKIELDKRIDEVDA